MLTKQNYKMLNCLRESLYEVMKLAHHCISAAKALHNELRAVHVELEHL